MGVPMFCTMEATIFCVSGGNDYADEDVLERLQVCLVLFAGALPRQEGHVGTVRQGRTHDFGIKMEPLNNVLSRVGHGHDNGCIWGIDNILKRSSSAARLRESQFIITEG